MQSFELLIRLFVLNTLLFLVVSIVVADLIVIAHQQVEDNTNNEAYAATTGKNSVAAALGLDAKAKAGAGGAIVLTHRNDDGDLICIRAAMVGQDEIKPNVWYTLTADGEFVESGDK